MDVRGQPRVLTLSLLSWVKHVSLLFSNVYPGMDGLELPGASPYSTSHVPNRVLEL